MSRPLFWVVVGVVAPLMVLTFGCSRAPDPWANEPAPTRVVTTIAPVASFVKAIGGDRVGVRCLCTVTGPHHFEAHYSDTTLLDRAHAVFAIGLELDESFIDAMYRKANQKTLRLVKLGEVLYKKKMVHAMRAHKHAPGQECDHHHGEYDPHVWLGVEESIVMLGTICDTLCEVDPEYSAEYKKNTEVYVAKLRQLHADGKKLLANKTNKRIISFHDAFEYFAKSFGIVVADVIELGPGVNPSAYHREELQKLCSREPVGAITVEPQYPDSTSARRLKESLEYRKVNVPLVSVDPLETADADELAKEAGDWYLTRMRKNIEALAGVLK